MQTLYHGSRVVVEQPEIRIQKFHKDFYWGFYCTSYEQQALRWATRFGKAGVVNVYSFDDQTELKIKRFPEMSDEWLDFIAACRNGVPNDYDVVEGPMADDTIFNYVQSFWMVRSPELLSGNWQNSSIPPIRSASTLHVLSLH